MKKITYKRFGDNPDPAQENLERGLAETIYLQQKAERLEKLVKQKKSRKRKNISTSMLRKYKLFIKKTDNQRLNPKAIFMYTNEKRSLLREVMSYTKLKGDKGRVPIDDCSKSQIGKAFRNNYDTAISALDSF